MIKVITICSVMLLLSCKPEKQEILWDEDKLVTVLADLRLIDNQIKQHKYYQKDSVKAYYKSLLLDIHEISEADLSYHIKLVQSDPTIAKSLEESIQKLLNDRIEENKKTSKEE